MVKMNWGPGHPNWPHEKTAFPPAIVPDTPPPGKEPQRAVEQRHNVPDPVKDPGEAEGYNVDGWKPWRPIDALVREVARPGERILTARAGEGITAATDIAVVELHPDLEVAITQLSSALIRAKIIVAWALLPSQERLRALRALLSTYQPKTVATPQAVAFVIRGLPNMQPSLDSPASKQWNPKPSQPQELQEVMQDPVKPLTDGPDHFPADPPPYPPSSPKELAPMSPFMGPATKSLGELTREPITRAGTVLHRWKSGAGPGDQQSPITDEGIAQRQMLNPALEADPARPLGPSVPTTLPDEHDSGGGRPRGERWEMDNPDEPRGNNYSTPLAGGLLCVHCGGSLTADKGDSFFNKCDRDENGHCKKGPGGGGGGKGKQKTKAPEKKPSPKDDTGDDEEQEEGDEQDDEALSTKVTAPLTKVDTGKRDKAGNPITEFRMEDGSPLPKHVPKLPPAWTDVKVNPDPNATLVAMGTDTKGRRIRVYSDQHHMAAAAKKFSRIRELRMQQDAMKQEMQSDLKSGDEKVKEAATVALLIQTTGIRPGSETDTGAEKQAYGATTLQAQHVIVGKDGSVSLQYTGKKGVSLNIPVKDSALAKMLVERKKAAGGAGDGKLFPATSSASLRDYVHEKDGGSFKPKDFRTAHGTNIADALVKSMPAPKDEKEYKRQVLEVAKQVSSALGNTPAVALQSYIDPTVFARWQGASA